MKISVDGLNSRRKVNRNDQSEQQREIAWKTNKQDKYTMKQRWGPVGLQQKINICVTTEIKRWRKGGTEKVLKEIMAKKLPNMAKDINL